MQNKLLFVNSKKRQDSKPTLSYKSRQLLLAIQVRFLHLGLCVTNNNVAGMTNANMQLAVLNVDLEDKMESPIPKLEIGEHIVTRVVELARLRHELEGMLSI